MRGLVRDRAEASVATIRSCLWVALQVFEQLSLDCLSEDSSDGKMEDGLEKGENGVGEENVLSQAFKFSWRI